MSRLGRVLVWSVVVVAVFMCLAARTENSADAAPAQGSAEISFAYPALPEGVSAGQEAVDHRTETSREIVLSDGRRQVEVFLDPIHFQDGEGTWRPIDTRLVVSSREGYGYENLTNTLRCYFPSAGSDAGIVAECGEYSVSFLPLSDSKFTTIPTAEAEGSQLTYPCVYPDVDLRYMVEPGALKEQIVLRNPEGPTSFVFLLVMKGLTAAQNTDGSISLRSEDGTERLLIPAPFMTDGATPGAFSQAVSQELILEGDRTLVKVTADPTWIASAERVFPVVIDPTVTVTAVSDDSYVDRDSPTMNFGSSTSIRVAADDEGPRREGLIKFTLPTLCENPSIVSAGINLYCSSALPVYDPKIGTPGCSLPIEAHAITAAWTESGVAYQGKPDYREDVDSTSTITTTGWYLLDITASAKEWYAGSLANYGHMLVPATEATCFAAFYSSEASYYQPTLTIVYLAGDPRHTTHSLGEFAGHEMEVVLDKQTLSMSTTDLEIDSFGPRAAVDRYYCSSGISTNFFAPGWRFSFERSLNFVSSTQIDYRDAQGEKHTFFEDGGVWLAPTGLVATLAQPTAYDWTLRFKDGTVLTFANGGGYLKSEADSRGNTVSYLWYSTSICIRAANGQEIVVTKDSGTGKVTGASYSTSSGARGVSYATASPWNVVYGQPSYHSVTYTYPAYSSELSSLVASGFSALAGSSTCSFLYTNHQLQEVRFPDYASGLANYNSSNSDARLVISYSGRSATLTSRGCVRTSGSPTGATGTQVTQTYTWNPDGTIATRTNPGAPSQVWGYEWSEDTNYLLSETNPLGKTRSWTYDARGDVLSEGDELGNETLYTYPSSPSDPNRDRPHTITDPLGSVTTYTYDTRGNTTHVVRTLNGDSTNNQADTIYTYADVAVGAKTFYSAPTSEQKLISGTSWATSTYNTDAYYPNGEPKKTVSTGVALSSGGTPVNLTVTRTYDDFGNLLTRTDLSGQVVETNTYDLAGNLLTSTGPSFSAVVSGSPVSTQIVHRHTYDPWGHETESWDTSTGDASGAKANWVTTAHDARGRVYQEKKWLWTAGNPSGQVQSTIDHRYDGMGREITRDDSTTSGQPALTAHDARGNVMCQWAEGVADYADAKATRHLLADGSSAYDAVDQVLRTAQAGDANSTVFTYTDNGRVSRETRPDGTWTDYTYDDGGNVTATEASDGATTSSTYDLAGRLTEKTAESNLTTSYTYDCLDRQTSAGADGQTATQMTYNTLGWLLSSTDSDSIETTRVFDQAGRITSETVATSVTSWTYDAAGNITLQDDPNDKWIQHEYDLLGRASRGLHTTPGSPRVVVKDTSTIFDSLGRPSTQTDNIISVSHSWTYPLNTPGSPSETVGVGAGAALVQSTITIGGNGLELSRLIHVASSPQIDDLLRTVDTRDAGQRLTKATLDAGGATNIVSQSLFDSAGRLQRQWGAIGGGSGYLADAESTNAYTYDAESGLKTADNLRLASVGTAGPIVSSYTYTPDGRLDVATTNGVAADHEFDVAGNLTSVTKGGIQTIFSYDTANRLQTVATGSQTVYFAWDTANGRRTSQGPTANEVDPRVRYTYTGTGRLATYVDETRSPSVSATYSYDALGQRTRSVIVEGSKTTTINYTYEGLTLLTLSATMVEGENQASWSITYLYDENGRPYAGVYRDPVTSTTPVLFGIVATDRGDVVGLVDADGTLFAAYRYDAWGNPQGVGNLQTGIWSWSTSLINSGLAVAIAVRQPLRYASYSYDAESDTYYLSARHYDPVTCQLLTKDPLKADGEETAYQYCMGDPIDHTDPSGCGPSSKYLNKSKNKAFFGFVKKGSAWDKSVVGTIFSGAAGLAISGPITVAALVGGAVSAGIGLLFSR